MNELQEAAQNTITQWAWLIPLFPLAGVLINGFFGKKLSKTTVGLLACFTVLCSFLLSIACVAQLAGMPVDARRVIVDVFPWIAAGTTKIMFGIMLDPLSSVMILVVSGVGFIIHVYSLGYIENDPGYKRFFTYLNLFTFSMLVLVLANSLALLFVGWELVGLCSYLLIGFWYHKDSAADAGKKAFIVNRVGDFGFLLGMLAIFWIFGSLNFKDIFHTLEINAAVTPWFMGAGTMPVKTALSAATPILGLPLVTIITLALFLGATGKSAQIPLYVWLPDAMEGPTPVSALIHAATMVTAGVYMVARLSMLFALSSTTMMVVAIVGAATAIFAATIGLVQNDIKRVLAYSTVSQLGYMFLACGVGAFSVGVFHLMTHAFFKALLFLCYGAVIHSCEHAFHDAGSHADPQDMRNMGGLWKYMKITWFTFLIGSMAIAGVPGLSGFFSKDEILWKAFNAPFSLTIGGFPLGSILWAVGALAAVMTAFYMFRLIFMTFHGKERLPQNAHPHESPPAMTIALIVLAFAATVGGYVGVPHVIKDMGINVGNESFYKWLEPVFEPAQTIIAEGGALEAIDFSNGGEEVGVQNTLAAGITGLNFAKHGQEGIITPEAGNVAVAHRESENEAAATHSEKQSAHENVALEKKLMNISIVLALLGIFVAFIMYNRNPQIHHDIREGLGVIHTVLLNKYYVDEIYYYTIVLPGRVFSEFFLWKFFDVCIIDGIVNGVALLVRGVSAVVRRIQTGVVMNYALVIVIGILAILAYYIF